MLLGLLSLFVVVAFAGFSRDFRRSLELSGTPLTSAAIDMEIDHAQLIRQLAGEGHLSVRRIARIDAVDFHRWLALLQARRHGLPEDVSAALEIERHMARMGLRQRQERTA